MWPEQKSKYNDDDDDNNSEKNIIVIKKCKIIIKNVKLVNIEVTEINIFLSWICHCRWKKISDVLVVVAARLSFLYFRKGKNATKDLCNFQGLTETRICKILCRQFLNEWYCTVDRWIEVYNGSYENV